MPDATMYLSGPPLHVLASCLLDRLATAMPGTLMIPGHDGDVMVSFSAGVTKDNLADTIATGVNPATICSDLLKPGGYGRMAPMLRGLAGQLEELGCADLDAYRALRQREALAAGTGPPAAYVAALHGAGGEPYRLAANEKLPRSVDHPLEMFGCVACNFCVTVCPNDAFFAIRSLDGMPDRQQYLVLAELCNECGNCMVFCPEDGDPAKIKPRLFTDPEVFDGRDGQGFLLSGDGTIAGARRRRSRLGRDPPAHLRAGSAPEGDRAMTEPLADVDGAAPGPIRETTGRRLRVAAAQLGPISRTDTREAVIDRLVALVEQAASAGVELVVFPELALTTFFPRWYVEDDPDLDLDSFYETEMPGPRTQRLFDVAKAHGVGFSLGYAELTPDGHRYNSQILVERDGSIVGKYRKVHLPGHREHEPWREFQHLERRYFEPGDEFPTFRAFGGVVGMAICNDRRWPETYRCLALGGAELILIGYNTPMHYAPDPSQDALQSFHSHLVMQAGAYQNGCYVIGVAKGGTEEGVESLADSCVIAPTGRIIALTAHTGDELAIAEIDLELCRNYTETLFQFERYRRPEVYGAITARRGPHPRGSTGGDAMISFELNGRAVTASDRHDHLLAALRDELGVTSPKDGCSPSGQCGCCTVLVDGKARVACQTSMEKTEGARVVTLEGLDPDERERMAATFAAHGALQCGFCTPGS
ncbi:MAG: nitrilase-related carbon-nitrogen hydrolase [Acidimicrobiales bacterium]